MNRPQLILCTYIFSLHNKKNTTVSSPLFTHHTITVHHPITQQYNYNTTHPLSFTITLFFSPTPHHLISNIPGSLEIMYVVLDLTAAVDRPFKRVVSPSLQRLPLSASPVLSLVFPPLEWEEPQSLHNSLSLFWGWPQAIFLHAPS